jgi:ATP-dependent RNA helicase DDX19/DBP5
MYPFQYTDFHRLLPKNIQTVLFSATFPEHVVQYAQKFAPKANVLTLAHEELTIEGIKQLYIDIDKDSDKYSTLLKFYGLMQQASSIIFVRVSRSASYISFEANESRPAKPLKSLRGAWLRKDTRLLS